MAASWSVSGSRMPSDDRLEMHSYKMGYRFLGFVLKLGELSILSVRLMHAKASALCMYLSYPCPSP